MGFPSSIFKAYDIRGLVGSELSEDLAYRVGRSFGIFLKKRYTQDKKVVVGRDMRETSPAYEAAVINGLTDEGWSVVTIGMATTPLFNFACAHYPEHVGGIMVTASHNPAAYNGFKMTLHDGLPVGKNTGMADIRDVAEKNDFGPVTTKGTIMTKGVLGDYTLRVYSLVDLVGIKPLKVVIDCGNGMADVTFPAVLPRLTTVKTEYLYLQPDGTFPNHEANPLKVETLKELQKRVVLTEADFGFALDGDADRVGLVDEKGQVVDASFVGALAGLEVLRRHPGALMLYDLRSSSIVKEVWEAAGGKTQMCQVGHAIIKKAMKDTGAVFASELSLHLYYKDMYDVESSDLSILMVMELLSRTGKPLSELVAPLKKYAHSGERNFETEHGKEIMAAVEKKYQAEALETSKIDGLYMKLPWGWFSIRTSNTEPLLRLNLETADQATTDQKVAEIISLISEK